MFNHCKKNATHISIISPSINSKSSRARQNEAVKPSSPQVSNNFPYPNPKKRERQYSLLPLPLPRHLKSIRIRRPRRRTDTIPNARTNRRIRITILIRIIDILHHTSQKLSPEIIPRKTFPFFTDAAFPSGDFRTQDLACESGDGGTDDASDHGSAEPAECSLVDFGVVGRGLERTSAVGVGILK